MDKNNIILILEYHHNNIILNHMKIIKNKKIIFMLIKNYINIGNKKNKMQINVNIK